MSDRPLGEEGFCSHKDRRFSDLKQREQTLEGMRERWAHLCARQLERMGLDIEAERWRHGHKTLPEQQELAEARGDHDYARECEREATKHLGVAASAMERKGEDTERGAINREIEARNAERATLFEERRSIGADLIGHAWHEADRDPVQFAVNLGDNGLSLATDKKGQFVAVDGAGYIHYLSGAALGDDRPADVQAMLGQTFGGGGLTVPTVDEVRAIVKAEQLELWKAERRAERRAAYVEKQRERHKDDETARLINYGYGASDSQASYAAALAGDGILLCRIAEDEAEHMAAARALAKEQGAERLPAAYEAGELLAVDRRGWVYRIDATTVYADDAAIAERFAGYDPGLTLTEAKDAQREYRQAAREAREAERLAQREAWKAQRAEEREARRIERQEARYERLADNRTLGQTIAAIGDAYNESLERGDFGAAFVAELEKRDLLYVVVSAEESERSKERHEVAASWGRYEPSYEEGQALVLDKSGRAYTLDRATIYDDPASIAANLATVTNEGQFSLDQGRDVMAWWREQEREEPRSYARDGESGGGNPEILLKQAGRLMEYAFHALGDVLEYFAGGMAPTARHTAGPTIDSAPEPKRNPARDGRDALRRTSWENAATDPQTQSLTQSHNADADMIAEIQRQIDEADRRRQLERER